MALAPAFCWRSNCSKGFASLHRDICNWHTFNQGLAFSAWAYKESMQDLGATLWYSSLYHPAGNSVVERKNHDLKQSSTARLLGMGSSWVNHLFGVQRALNIPRISQGGQTPYELVWGKIGTQPRVPASSLNDLSQISFAISNGMLTLKCTCWTSVLKCTPSWCILGNQPFVRGYFEVYFKCLSVHSDQEDQE